MTSHAQIGPYSKVKQEATHGNTPGTLWPPLPEHGKADCGFILGYEMQGGYSTGYFVVEDFVEGSPASIAGIAHVGHRLVNIDGRSVFGLTLVQTARLLEGRPKSTVNIEMCDPRKEGISAYTRVNYVRRHAVPHYTTLSHTKSKQVSPVKTQRFGYVRDFHSYDMKCPQNPDQLKADFLATKGRPAALASKALAQKTTHNVSIAPELGPSSFQFL